MGNSNSGRPRKKPTDPRIQALGEKFPFGDAELIQLVQCHETCVESSSSKSFLSRLASACASPERRDGTEIIIVLMEQHILPPGFSELLCKSIFGLDYEDYLGTRKKTSVSGGNGNSDLLLDAFLEGMGSCLGRRGDRSSLFTLLRCSSSESPDDILDLAYRLALAVECWISCRDPEEGVTTETIVKSFIPQGKLTEMSQSLLTACEEMNNQNHSFSTDFLSPTHSTSKPTTSQDGHPKVSKENLLQWATQTAPLLSSIIGTFFQYIIFPSRPFPTTKIQFRFPRLSHGSAFFGYGADTKVNYPFLFSFGCVSKSLGGTWHRLYTSDQDGLSFNRLLKTLSGYFGPTLFIISASSGNTFGVYTSAQWKEDKNYYGNPDTFIFRLTPALNIYRSRGGTGGNYQYCNPASRSKGYDGLLHGIGFGGDVEDNFPRLFLSEALEGNLAKDDDLTFDHGPIFTSTKEGISNSRESFEIDSLEVWGVGGDDAVKLALGEREKVRDVATANIKKALKVDKAQFLDDLKSGLLGSKTFKHREEVVGRIDLCSEREEEEEE